jgi:DNA-binding transcriptional MerR regulator
VADRPYLSIGEVLALLKDEFADVTISKIRFLESQGLIDPERTPSGYRKFYEAEVERLRWILRQQKEHYLPLRVIKGKLSDGGIEDLLDDADDAASATEPSAAQPSDDERTPATPEDQGVPADDPPASPAPLIKVVRDEPEPETRPRSSSSGGGDPGRRPPPPFPESLRRGREGRSSPAAFLTAPDASAGAAPAVAARADLESDAPAGRLVEAGEDAPPAAVELTAEELAATCGVTVVLIAELESYGLVKGQNGPGGRYYDGQALEIVRLAADFGRYGVEPRHLKQWKSAAERQADVIEQVVAPLRRQRNPDARRQASEAVVEMAVMGLKLHRAFLRGAVSKLQ